MQLAWWAGNGWAGWTLAALAGWTAIGLLGTLVSVARRERGKAWRGAGWICAVWAVYLGVVLTVGRMQQQKVIERGQEECFGTVCFAVTGMETVGEFKGAGGGRLVTVRVRVINRGKDPEAAEGIRAYLLGADGRVWTQTAGLGGVALAVRLPPGAQTESAPVFRVEGAARGLQMVLTRGREGWGWLEVGNTDSLGHRPTALRLE